MESCTAIEQEGKADFFESGVQQASKEALNIQTKAAELEQMNTYFASTFCVLQVPQTRSPSTLSSW